MQRQTARERYPRFITDVRGATLGKGALRGKNEPWEIRREADVVPGTGLEPVWADKARGILSRIMGTTPMFSRLRHCPLEQVFSRSIKPDDTPVFDPHRPDSLSLGS